MDRSPGDGVPDRHAVRHGIVGSRLRRRCGRRQGHRTLTSIAWLFWHVGSQPGRAAELDFFGDAHSAGSGWTSPYIATHPMFTSAEDAVSAVRTGWRALDTALRSATDAQLEGPARFWGYGGPGPMGTGARIIGQILNEVSHHGTQIGIRRDFYQVRAAI